MEAAITIFAILGLFTAIIWIINLDVVDGGWIALTLFLLMLCIFLDSIRYFNATAKETSLNHYSLEFDGLPGFWRKDINVLWNGVDASIPRWENGAKLGSTVEAGVRDAIKEHHENQQFLKDLK